MKVQFANRLRRHLAYWHIVRGLLVVIALALVFQLAHLWQGYRYGSPGTNDFVEYWSAGQLLKAGESPYDFEKLYKLQLELGSPHEFPIIMWNPPWLLIWIFPLLLPAFPIATMAWLVLNFGLILGSATLVWRAFVDPSSGKPIGIAWVGAIAFVPALFTLRMGQTSSFLILGVAGFLYFASRDRDFFAGMCLALTTIKPHVVYLLWIAVVWWVVTRRRWKTVAGTASLLLPTLVLLTLMWPGWLSGYRATLAQPPLHWGTATMGGILRLLVLTKTPQAQFLPALVGGVLFPMATPHVSGVAALQFLPSLVGGALFLGYLLIKRPAPNWKTIMGPLLLVSVPTAAYGWSFDQIVLLVTYLEIIVWLTEDHPLSVKQKVTLIASLLLIAGVMVVQNLLGISELFFFWVPWALGAVYVYVQATCRSMGKARFPKTTRVAPTDRGL